MVLLPHKKWLKAIDGGGGGVDRCWVMVGKQKSGRGMKGAAEKTHEDNHR